MKLSKNVGKGCFPKPTDVITAQRALSSLKAKNFRAYYSGSIDGRQGAKTIRAIMCFQADNGISPTGKIETHGPTINKLRQKLPIGFKSDSGLSNPSKQETDQELARQGALRDVPLKALQALILAESDYRQFDRLGKPLLNEAGMSSAVGLGQITRTTAGQYGKDYERLKIDWRYNVEVSVIVFAAGYNHPWNEKITDARIRAARAYGMYHDGFEPSADRERYSRHPRVLTGTSWEERYLSRY